MPTIRLVDVRNFRGIKSLNWAPLSGLNAIIGAGDAGKSTILDAIELALAPTRTQAYSDADFWRLDVSRPIDIRITVGGLPEIVLDLARKIHTEG